MNDNTTVIYKLLERLEEKYLTPEKIRRAIIDENVSMQNKIEFIESLCRMVITALNFGNYKRAVKYLALATAFCEKYLSQK